MIKETVYIERYGWLVHAYFHKSFYDVDEIMEHLWDIGCDGSTAQKAYENLRNDSLNMGLCYSNYGHRETVFVIGRTSSADEFFNSFLHECTHLQSHICSALYLEPAGEGIAYAMGEFSKEVYPKISHLLCDCCRKEYNDGKKEEKTGHSYYGIG